MIKQLYDDGLINPPGYLPTNMQYEAIVGSVAYGMSDDDSDLDIVGFTIPPKGYLLPQHIGCVTGFDPPNLCYESWQQHHIKHKDKNYDLAVYNIANFFRLCADGNPNMLECLFVDNTEVMLQTKIGIMVRDKRHLFLSKRIYSKFIGYALSQMSKAQDKKPTGKRKELVDKFGYDTKFAAHAVRLLLECFQILKTENLSLKEEGKFKIFTRSGGFTLDELNQTVNKMNIEIEKEYEKTKLPCVPDEHAIRELLFNCLEEHYGKLDCVNKNRHTEVLKQIRDLINKENI